MKKSRFSLAAHKNHFLELVKKTDHKTLAVWAIDCAERVMPYFEGKYPDDLRPRHALETLQAWIDTGVFKMAVIRKASLAAHVAPRAVGEDSPARSAAHAAGQAVATAHVPTHSIGEQSMPYRRSIEPRTSRRPMPQWLRNEIGNTDT